MSPPAGRGHGRKAESMYQYGGSVLYHYTDFQAVDGILRQAQLRVNNVLRMNDSGEMRHFMTRLCSAILDRLEREGDGRYGSAVRELFRAEMKKEYSAYAACFSFHRDDAAQWERYGNRGRGICIAFQREHLEKIAQDPCLSRRFFIRTTWRATPWWRCSAS